MENTAVNQSKTDKEVKPSIYTFVSETVPMYNTTFFSESCTIQCQNGGFPIKPLSGSCKCKCPSGLKGDYCEQVEKSASNYQVAIIKK